MNPHVPGWLIVLLLLMMAAAWVWAVWPALQSEEPDEEEQGRDIVGHMRDIQEDKP